jgi:peptidoglycan/xylan/chitin deacetylase (PgdA/CDA1 family)
MTRVISLLFHDVFDRDPAESGFRGPNADRYKVSARQLSEGIAALATALNGPPLCLTGEVPETGSGVTITADDGGVSYYSHLAPALERHGWRGHCFMSTDMIGTAGFLDADQLRDLDERGHVIGSHSATHPTRFSACTWAQMVREWSQSRERLEDLLGHRVRVASLPGGYFSKEVARSADAAGILVLFTSEPTTRPWFQGCCLVVGRHTIRPSHGAAHLRALVGPSPAARWTDWSLWNAKKLIKPMLGAAYPRLGAWLGHLSPSVPLRGHKPRAH